MIYQTSFSIWRNASGLAIGTTKAITVRLVANRAEWDALMEACPAPHLPQSFAYGEAKAATGWTPRRALFLIDRKPIAMATVLEFRRFGLRLANRINRGPVFFDANPSKANIIAVYGAIRRRWGRFWLGPLLIAPALPDTDESRSLLRNAGYRSRHPYSWRSGRVDLTQTEDELWASFTSTFRNRARNAEKAGAELRVADDDDTFEWMLARHAENVVEKGFTAVGSSALRALRAAAPSNALVFQLIYESKPVAGMLVVRFGSVAEYYVGWFGPQGRKLNAGNFLMWHAMREMKRRGVARFDVGGMSTDNGYARFKRTMNPVEYQLSNEWISF
jgi:hypothetical protein